MKSKLVPYEIIEKAVGGDTASLLAIQQHYKPYIAYLSHDDTDLNDLLNSKLLESILKFKLDYQPPSKYVRVMVSPNRGQKKPVFMRLAEVKITEVRVLYSHPSEQRSTA